MELVTILSRDPGPPPVSYIATSGGLFRDMMIHDLDMARFLLLGDEPVEVHAVGSSLVDPAIGKAGDVDTAAVMLKTAKGRIVQISNSRRATYGYDQRIEVHGSKGMIRAGNIHRTTVEVANASGVTADPVQDFFLERYAEAYRAELAAFLDAVTRRQAVQPDRPRRPDGPAPRRCGDGIGAERKAGAGVQRHPDGVSDPGRKRIRLPRRIARFIQPLIPGDVVRASSARRRAFLRAFADRASAIASAKDAERERKAPKSASATSSQTSALVTSGLKAESVIATTGTSRRAAAAASSAVTGA